jgi:hypothetical protein
MESDPSKQPSKLQSIPSHVRRVVGVGAIVVIVILAVLAWGLSNLNPTPQSTSSTGEATSTPESVATTQSSSTTKASKIDNMIVVARVENQKLVLEYFDKNTKKLARKEIVANAVSELMGSACGENDKVQFLANGDVYYRDGQSGGMGGNDEPALFSAIYKSPGKVIYRSDDEDRLFNTWRVTADGTKIYLAQSLPRPTPETVDTDYELLSIDTATGKATTLANIGNIDGELTLSKDETKVGFLEDRERREDGKYYRDSYLKVVDVASKAVSEKQIYKQSKPEWSPYDACGAKIGPNFKKVISDSSPLNGFPPVLLSLDLDSLKEESLYSVGGMGQINPTFWSADGSKVLYSISSFGADIPTDQGVVEYNFGTKTTKQLVRSNIKMHDPEHSVSTGGVHLIDGSYSDDGFAYSTGESDDLKTWYRKVYYYSVADKKSYELFSDASGVLAVHTYK